MIPIGAFVRLTSPAIPGAHAVIGHAIVREPLVRSEDPRVLLVVKLERGSYLSDLPGVYVSCLTVHPDNAERLHKCNACGEWARAHCLGAGDVVRCDCGRSSRITAEAEA